nr:immunoglobulin light chain junction region [Macaca mulatta]MPN90812.1 immunoglobulin light chain junction region [Macaca mulatta]MPN90814.1 immunoglobulin light chain junction region [Macaca mulatta]MPN90819.1 immunoglobulin light chain junction region [Macaca mulatta]MPN90864.1 immunoglobulin light chain junction region [Macaca mulatta]
CQQESNWPTF